MKLRKRRRNGNGPMAIGLLIPSKRYVFLKGPGLANSIKIVFTQALNVRTPVRTWLCIINIIRRWNIMFKKCRHSTKLKWFVLELRILAIKMNKHWNVKSKYYDIPIPIYSIKYTEAKFPQLRIVKHLLKKLWIYIIRFEDILRCTAVTLYSESRYIYEANIICFAVEFDLQPGFFYRLLPLYYFV